MKKFVVGIALVAFASVAALQAGESKEKGKAASSVSAKGACADQVKGGCEEKSACCEKKAAFKRTYDPSVKGAMLLVKK